MYREQIEKDICEIQRRRRKEILTYRKAVQVAPRKPSCTRYVLTHGVKFHHVTSFLGINAVIATTNVHELKPNDCVHVIDVKTTRRSNCVVRKVASFRDYGIFPESRGIVQDLILKNKFCYEIEFAKKVPGYFNNNDPSSFVRVSLALTKAFRPDLKYNLDEYPFKASIFCFTDKDGEIIEFANGDGGVNYILVKK